MGRAVSALDLRGLMFEVRAIPAPQGSKRHVGNGILVESGGQKLKDWRNAVRTDCVAAMKATGFHGWGSAVEVRIRFQLPRPKSHYRTGRNAHLLRADAPHFVSKRPDIDKLLRATLDALTAAGVYMDDAQVAALEVTKMYGTPGALITVLPLEVSA